MVLLFAGGDALNHIPHPSWHVLPFAGLYSAVPTGLCQPLLHLVTPPARNIALSLFQTSLSQSPLDTQLELATRRRVPMFKVVPNIYLWRIFWSSWCRWWWNAESMGYLECKGSVFVQPVFSCFVICTLQVSKLNSATTSCSLLIPHLGIWCLKVMMGNYNKKERKRSQSWNW